MRLRFVAADSKSVPQKVNDAFDQATLDTFGQRYLELVYENWSDVVKTMRRTVLLCVVLVASFFLLDDPKNASVTIGPLKTGNIYAVLTLIPAVVSFLLFEAVDMDLAIDRYYATASQVVRKLYPKLYANNLEYMLEPTSSVAWGAGTSRDLEPQRSGKVGKVLDVAERIAILGLVLGVVVFLGYAYVTLYGSDHTNWIPVTFSLLFSLFNLARIVGYIWVAIESEP